MAEDLENTVEKETTLDLDFESIVPWNGHQDTGRDVRLKLDRNWQKVAAAFHTLAVEIKNPISSGALTQPITSDANSVGHVTKGITFPTGTTFEEIFRRIFLKQMEATLISSISTGNMVEYGTPKGSISYTAKRNDNGPILDAYYDNDTTNKIDFSEEDSEGVSYAIRSLTGIYTSIETYHATVIFAESEDGETPQTTKIDSITVNVMRKWFAGVVSNVPTTSSEVRGLSSSGFYQGKSTYSFHVTKWTKFVICIPKDTIYELTLTKYAGNFIEDTSLYEVRDINVEGANGSASAVYKMWIFQTSGENDEDTFTFKTN